MTTNSQTSPPSVKICGIDERNHGQRIDNYLMSQLKGVPKSHIYRLLRSGQVRVNKGRAKPSYRLQEGDQVRIPPVRRDPEPQSPLIPKALLNALADSILYEDDNVLIINKPAGVAVHAGSGIRYGVIEALKSLRHSSDMLELAHRLDRETSGCLALVKRRPALIRLHDLFRSEKKVKKCYHALLSGHWTGAERLVEAPLGKNVLRGGERMVTVTPEGKPASSLFKPIKRFGNATLVEIQLFTGRTHQIRVHAAYIGHPVAGDDKYGDPAFNKYIRDLGLKRMFLHANELAFELNGLIKVTAPYDDALHDILTKLA